MSGADKIRIMRKTLTSTLRQYWAIDNRVVRRIVREQIVVTIHMIRMAEKIERLNNAHAEYLD